MTDFLAKIDLKKYGLMGGIFVACFLIGVGIWMYAKDVPSPQPELGIEVSSIPPSSVGEEPEFSDANINPLPLEPILEEETSGDIFIEVKETSALDEKEKVLSSDFYFNQGVSYDKKNQKELAASAYAKALFLSETEPFHFSREAVLQRLKFLRGS